MAEDSEKTEDDLDGPGKPAEVAPDMSPKLLARLFAVPLLIVVMIVGCSLAVFLLFGWISEGREQSIEKLVERIEAGAGEKLLDVAMLPKDKEVWQAAADLANRLHSDQSKLSPEERARVAARLGSVLEKSAKARQGEGGQGMQEYLLIALGKLEQPESVPLLVAYANDDAQPVGVRRNALMALELLKAVPAARQVWPQVAGLLDSPEPVLRLVAVTTLGTLADRGDEAAVTALRRAYHSGDREVQWTAAVALARLGDASPAALLSDMLARAYWESVQATPEPGESPESKRRLPPDRVDEYLMHTIDAARSLGTPALRKKVETLTNDASPQVRDRAKQSLKGWPSES
jgi:HEAT repeat protein